MTPSLHWTGRGALIDTTLDPKQTDPRHVLLARADEELTHAYDQITRANEEIARAEKQLSKLEQDRMPSRATDHCLTGRRYAASCIGVAAIAWQSSYGDAAKEIIARWTTLMPGVIALIKAERDRVETYALSLHAGKDIVGRFLDDVDKRHAETTSRMLSARADCYRAYEDYVAVLAGEFGAYKVVNGQFIFPLQRTVDRYNAAAQAMTVAAKRLAELQEERRQLMQSQQQRWEQFVNSQ